MRFVATVLLIEANAKVVFKYLEFKNTLYEVTPHMYTGRLDLPELRGRGRNMP